MKTQYNILKWPDNPGCRNRHIFSHNGVGTRNLLNHPNILEKAKAEIDSQIGHTRLVDEGDLPRLPYIQNIVSETLRLHPPAPLHVQHYSSDDCEIGGYSVSRGTMVLLNAWAIQRDGILVRPVELQA